MRQASEALRLYRYYQSTQSTTQPSSNTTANAASSASAGLWDDARTQLIEIIRLKHLSISAEQAHVTDRQFDFSGNADQYHFSRDKIFRGF
jgi:xanthine dehydrogenase molybdopterin-binding subunit B